jgi:glycosyltransferase involved in cell wall biosynthesis
MKILHISTHDQGGAPISAIRLHTALLAQGVESSILFLSQENGNIPASFVYSNPTRKYRSFLLKIIFKVKDKFINFIRFQYPQSQKLQNKVPGFEMFSFNPSYFDVTKQQIYKEADIIHLHWVPGFVDFQIFIKNKKPIVWTLLDMNPFTGGCHYSSGCMKYKTECKNCPQLQGTKNSNNSFLDQQYKKAQLIGQAPVITAPSKWLTECSAQSRLFGNFKNLLMPSSLDLSVFKPLDKSFCRAALNLPQDKKIVLFVSYSIENKRKGFDLLRDAIKQVNSPYLHICAVGSFNTGSDSELESTFLGKIYDERLMALVYAAADVFLLPSREDNLPNTMLESLACGTPVIAFPIGGMLDVIITGSNGILADDLSSNSLSLALNDFFDGRYKFNRDKISKNAHELFSPVLQAKKYVSLYEEMLQ